jgi:hypothetical protein
MSQTGVWSVAWRRQARKKVSFCKGANEEGVGMFWAIGEGEELGFMAALCQAAKQGSSTKSAG